jgi:hypothetical protein
MASVLLASWFCVARQNIVRFPDVGYFNAFPVQREEVNLVEKLYRK